MPLTPDQIHRDHLASRGADTMSEQPRTEAGQVMLERLRDVFASWESLAEYHNIATDELDDPLPFIVAIEREAAARPLDVEALARTLVEDDGQGQYEWSDLSEGAREVQRKKARRLAAIFDRILAGLSQPGGSDAE